MLCHSLLRTPSTNELLYTFQPWNYWDSPYVTKYSAPFQWTAVHFLALEPLGFTLRHQIQRTQTDWRRLWSRYSHRALYANSQPSDTVGSDLR